ncbi:PaaI family thioesterase [Mycobacterium stomatepiae]|uniref:Aromatic compound degradation protein PaaI n=1 Tax=Mycobacterium stomatepiae TaxID=470076 RepID=A0A7I7QCZ9_9MYCO|nr:PaaI family thioesterase [Mycobacterium stomatepiae]MCV7167897.1 PaaI family thioesterase [Mycobacterium stomatepiae]BBY24021.1 aromatic compound degradation protein PaaI [Mycobacterium stomatepiae]
MTTSSHTDMPSSPPWGAEQSRTITWRDPMTTQATVASMSGLSYWRAVADGHLPPPPIGELVQMGIVAVENGAITFSWTPDGSMYNPLGLVHGGAVCTLLDTVAACALHTTLPQGVGYTSVEIKVNYLKAMTLDSGPLTAVGSVVRAGSRIGFAEGEFIDASGNVVATASTTLLIFELRR